MKQPKFIITSRCYLRLGMVSLHKDLLCEGEQCYGGGYYELDSIEGCLLLHGKSFDFGPPRWHWMSCLKVPVAYRGLQIVYQSSKPWENDFVVSDEISIEYF